MMALATSHPHLIDRLAKPRGRLAAWMPAANGRFARAMVCMYANTPDSHFVLDFHPDHPQVLVASPCSGHGFKFAPVVGEVLADLAMDGRTDQPVDFLSAARFTPVGG